MSYFLYKRILDEIYLYIRKYFLFIQISEIDPNKIFMIYYALHSRSIFGMMTVYNWLLQNVVDHQIIVSFRMSIR